jgi:hypothetical protein
MGFLGLFFNFAVLKQFFYYPTLTDQFAFTLGILLFYYFYRNNDVGILITTFIGAFTWPLFIYYGLILYLFPIGRKVELKKNKFLSIVFAAIAALILFAYIYYLYFIQKIKMPEGTIQFNEQLILLSIFVSVMFLFLALSKLFFYFGLPVLKSFSKSTSITRIIITIIVYFGVKFLIKEFSSDEASTLSIVTLVQRIVLASIVRPFNFMLAHIVYFGPIMFMFIFFWDSICVFIEKLGFGMFLFVGLNLALSLNSESRTIISSFPIFIFLLLGGLNKFKFPYWIYWIFALSTFIYSKLWLPLGNVVLREGYFKLPYQWYFMNYGPWISDQMYVIQGVFSLLLGFILCVMIARNFNQIRM